MIRNFFTTAYRNILKHKVYAAINFFGLTCGLALALLIISYVRHELEYDRFHERADRLYRLSYVVPNGLKLALSPPPIAPNMKDFFPEVENAARVFVRNVSIGHHEGRQNESFEETNILFADSAIMHMFSFSWVAGDSRRALQEKFTVLITDEMAKKYFGNNDPLGQSLVLGGKYSFKVTGVVKDFPESSHLRFHMLVPFENMYDLESDASAKLMRANLATNFIISHSYTYVLLKPGGSPAAVNGAMAGFLKKYCPPDRMIGQKFELMPLTDIHLTSTLMAEPSSVNSMTNIFIIAGIGLLTLLIACINYINLSTAQSFTRVKEIGIRKILGSAKNELVIQFLAESFLFCGVAFVLSYVVFYLTLPVMNEFTGKHLLFTDVADLPLVLSSVGLLLVVTVLAGGYPAYFVAQFNSISSLKGTSDVFSGSHFLRKALVVVQLAIACMLLSGSMVLIRQMNYLDNRPLGFQKDFMIDVPLYSQNFNSVFARADSAFQIKLQTFRDRIETQSEVEGTTVSSDSPGLGLVYRGAIPEGFTKDDNLFVADLSVDYSFLKTYGMKLKAGRAFSKEFGTDQKEGFIVNETAVREFRWGTPDRAIGKEINREGKKGHVVGVVADCNMASLTQPISSMIMEVNPNQWRHLSVRLKNEHVTSLMTKLKAEWENLFPEKTFEFSFLDQQLNQQYLDFRNFGKIIQSFTLIAILIACLGVYGLVLFVVQRKVKEIGVRKVLGASAGGILRLIYSDFARLIVVGFVLAVPASYYFIGKWLENFSFHIDVTWVTYAFSFVLILAVAAVTIGYHAMKAALANPVQSLRSE